MGLLDVDEAQAEAILSLQLRRLAALERLKIQQESEELRARVKDLREIIASPERQRGIVSDELAEIVEKYGDERRTRIVPFDGEMSMEDLIPEEDVVVTITRSGYAKRTRTDSYRSQHRGGKGIRGATLREDDVVDHFFVTTTHRWLLFFTNYGRVYRAKGYELPEGGRDSKGQHVANLLAFQPGEEIAQVMELQDYEQADYLVLATRRGLVKKTRLSEYNSNRSGGVIAINLRQDEEGNYDELVSARLLSTGQDLLLVSRAGQSLRFHADDDTLRPRAGPPAASPECASVRTTTCWPWTSSTPPGRTRTCSSSPRAATPSAPTSWTTPSRVVAAWASRSPTSSRPEATSWAPW